MVETRRLSELGAGLSARAVWPPPPFRVALSGGADSAALARLALATGHRVDAVHVHHDFPGSDELAGAAGDIARTLGIELLRIAISVEEGPSPEARAREARYEAIAAAGDWDGSVLVGHTRDDVAETVLINLIRGTGLSGLSGIPYFREPNIFRPLLDVSRSETREYAALSGLDFRDDPMNSDLSLRRNWVRLELIPMLQRANPAIVESLARTAHNLNLDAAVLDGLFTTAASAFDERASIAIGELLAVPEALRWRMVSSEVGMLRGGPGVAGAEMSRIIDVIENRSAGTELEGGIRVWREGPYLRMAGG